MFWLHFCSWTPAELQNGNIPLQSQKRYPLSYTANCPVTRSPPRRRVCMPPEPPLALIRPQSPAKSSACRRAPESIVERLCKWRSFLLVHVWGDVAALVVSPLQKTTKRRLLSTSRSRLCRVCFRLFACAGVACNAHTGRVLHTSCQRALASRRLLRTRGVHTWTSAMILYPTLDHFNLRQTGIFISL